MNTLDDFENTKEQFEESHSELKDLLEEIEDINDPSKCSKQLIKSKNIKGKLDKLIIQMDA